MQAIISKFVGIVKSHNKIGVNLQLYVIVLLNSLVEGAIESARRARSWREAVVRP
jgi:hypothetical protein